MPLMILGLVFAVGLFAFYLFCTSGNSNNSKTPPPGDDDLKQEENVIFLPSDIEGVKRKHKKNR